eukprot:EG_transcript_5895
MWGAEEVLPGPPVCVSVCLHAVPPNYAFLDPDVFLAGDVVSRAGLPFPRRRDELQYRCEPHKSGRNQWRVTEVLALRRHSNGREYRAAAGCTPPPPISPIEARVVKRLEDKLAAAGVPIHVGGLQGYLGNPQNGGCPEDRAVVADWRAFAARHTDKFQYEDSGRLPTLRLIGPFEAAAIPPLTSSAAPTHSLLQLKLLLAAVIGGCTHFPVVLSALSDEMKKRDPWALESLTHYGYQRNGPKKFTHFVLLTLNSFPIKLAGYNLERGKSTVCLAKAANWYEETLTSKRAIQPWTPNPTVSQEASTGDAESLEDLDSMVDGLEGGPEGDPPSQLLVRLLGMEAATRVAQRGQGRSPSDGGPDSISAKSESPATSEVSDYVGLDEVCRALLDTLVAQPQFPVGLKALAKQLDERCPTLRAILAKNGFPSTFRGFMDFLRLTMDCYPDELCDLDSNPDENGASVVTWRPAAVDPDPAPLPPEVEEGKALQGAAGEGPGQEGAVEETAEEAREETAEPEGEEDEGQGAEASADAPSHDDLFVAPAAVLGNGLTYVDITSGLEHAAEELRASYEACLAGSSAAPCRHLALCCRADSEGLTVAVFATPQHTYVFDMRALGAAVCDALGPLLVCRHLLKVLHDVRGHAAHFWRLGVH